MLRWTNPGVHGACGVRRGRWTDVPSAEHIYSGARMREVPVPGWTRLVQRLGIGAWGPASAIGLSAGPVHRSLSHTILTGGSRLGLAFEFEPYAPPATRSASLSDPWPFKETHESSPPLRQRSSARSDGAGSIPTSERCVQAFEDLHPSVGADDLEQPHGVPGPVGEERAPGDPGAGEAGWLAAVQPTRSVADRLVARPRAGFRSGSRSCVRRRRRSGWARPPRCWASRG